MAHWGQMGPSDTHTRQTFSATYYSIVYSEVPNRGACSLRFFRFIFHPALKFSACSYNKSKKHFLPASLFHPAFLAISPNWLLEFWPFLWSLPSCSFITVQQKFQPARLWKNDSLLAYSGLFDYWGLQSMWHQYVSSVDSGSGLALTS